MSCKITILALVKLLLVRFSTGSITGITYMDDYDFEEKYRDVTECDPFYWHPLHLPEHCAEMLEQLIRSRLATRLRTPLRVVKHKRRHQKVRYTEGIPTYEGEILLGGDSSEYLEQLPPYAQMLELLRHDVQNQPTAPKIGIMANIGPVAVYQQPISKNSETMIKTMAKAYAKAYKTSGVRNYGGLNGQIDILESKETRQKTMPRSNEHMPKGNDPQIISRKYKNGNFIKILKKN